jgi:hypothetical protein
MPEKQQGSLRSRAFASFDAMFAIVPSLLMLLLVAQASHFLMSEAAERMHRQETFDRLVSAADYVVKQGAVKTNMSGPGERSPNWLDGGKLTDALADGTRQKAGLGELTITLDPAQAEGSFCIYRIVVVDDAKGIRKLYVCGG